jgi:hypothetical protein
MFSAECCKFKRIRAEGHVRATFRPQEPELPSTFAAISTNDGANPWILGSVVFQVAWMGRPRSPAFDVLQGPQLFR